MPEKRKFPTRAAIKTLIVVGLLVLVAHLLIPPPLVWATYIAALGPVSAIVVARLLWSVWVGED